MTSTKNNKKSEGDQVPFNNTNDHEDRGDRLRLGGIVEEALPGTLFQIRTETGSVAICTLSGKLRVNRIRLLPGDEVTIEVSPYDLSKGRVTWRK